MAISHAEPGRIIDLRPLRDEIAETKTHTLLKTEALEVIRLVMPAGKKIAEHKAPGEITVQCLEGSIDFTSGGATQRMNADEMLFLAASDPHSLEAIEDASVLVTILLRKKEQQGQ